MKRKITFFIITTAIAATAGYFIIGTSPKAPSMERSVSNNIVMTTEAVPQTVPAGSLETKREKVEYSNKYQKQGEMEDLVWQIIEKTKSDGTEDDDYEYEETSVAVEESSTDETTGESEEASTTSGDDTVSYGSDAPTMNFDETEGDQ